MNDVPAPVKTGPQNISSVKADEKALEELAEISNAADDNDPQSEKLLVLGPAGAGKTTMEITLPGRKFAYFFDPNGKRAIQGYNIDYLEFLPDASEVDWTLKSFNRDSRPSDRPKSSQTKEPTVYNRWEDDLNNRYDRGFFANYNWLIIDSLSLCVYAMMARLLWLNKRYGDIEELSDYRVTGRKMAEVFLPITSLHTQYPKLGLYCTGHLIDRQNELTKKITTELDLPGAARTLLPKMFSNIFEVRQTREGELQQYNLLTRSDPRGYQGLRCSFKNIDPIVDMTIRDFKKPEDFGIGALLARHNPNIAALRKDGPVIPVERKPATSKPTSAPANRPATPPASSPVKK